jgi:hypothetical protein
MVNFDRIAIVQTEFMNVEEPLWVANYSSLRKINGLQDNGFWRDPRPTGLTRAVWANKPGKRPAP